MANKGKRGEWTQSAESNAKRSAAMRGRTQSPEARAKMSVAKKGKPGRPMSAENRAKLSVANLGRKLSDEHRAKLSAAKIGKPGPWRGKKPGPHSEQWKRNIAVANKGRPAYFPMKRFYYRDVPFRSGWEMFVAQAFDRRGIRWEWEGTYFPLTETTGYRPDLYLPDLDCYWEVKGYFGPDSKAKVQLFRELYPGISLIVATEKVIAQLDRAFDPRAKAISLENIGD